MSIVENGAAPPIHDHNAHRNTSAVATNNTATPKLLSVVRAMETIFTAGQW
jgi:hypothetical protein